MNKRSTLRTRTPAQRAAIDKRLLALRRTRSSLHRVRAGWHTIEDDGTILSDQTIMALITRGLAARDGKFVGVVITAAGRREAARHR